MVNQRRRQVVAVLAALTAATLVLAVVTQSDAVLYGFVVSAIVLCSYCYQLAQRARNQPVQSMRTPYRRVA
jgi:4-amino-4-deoxy-L-arabinose transferase-like glycosyltransferase